MLNRYKILKKQYNERLKKLYSNPLSDIEDYCDHLFKTYITTSISILFSIISLYLFYIDIDYGFLSVIFTSILTIMNIILIFHVRNKINKLTNDFIIKYETEEEKLVRTRKEKLDDVFNFKR